MSKSDSTGESHVYRVDKFVVPAAARQEFQNEAVLDHVRAAVGAFHKEIAFDPQELITRLGIKADIGVYARISDR